MKRVSVHKQLELARQIRNSRSSRRSLSQQIYEHEQKRQSETTDGSMLMLEKQAQERADKEDADDDEDHRNDLKALRRQTASRLTIMGLRSPIDEGAPGELLASTPFQVCMAIVILLNAMVIGYETNWPDLWIWEPVELFFLLIFLSELALRVLVFGPSIYFHLENPDIAWNMFDVAVVATGVFGTMADSLNLISNNSGGLATLLRVVRLLRVFRIFRIVRFLKELYMLVFGFGIAAVATLWVTILAMVILYVYAVIAVRVADSIPKEDVDYDFLQNDFNKVGKSMFMLFELMLQAEVGKYEHAMETYGQVAFLLIGFLIFARFGMLSLLTGVITECMFEQNTMRKEDEQNERAQRRRLLSALASELFDDVLLECAEDQFDHYNIELPVDMALKQLPSMMRYLEHKGFRFSQLDLQDALRYADTDGSGCISKTEFLHAMSMICNDVQAGSILELHGIIQNNQLQADKRVSAMVDLIEKQDTNEKACISNMCDTLSSLERKLDRFLRMAAAKDAKNNKNTKGAKSTKKHGIESILKAPKSPPAAQVAQDLDSPAQEADKEGIRVRTCLALRIDECEAMVREMRQPINDLLIWARKSAAPELHAVPTGVDPWSAREFEAPLDVG